VTWGNKVWVSQKMATEEKKWKRTNEVTKKTKLNSVALVRERTISTERPPPVDEVSANFFG